MDRIAYTDLPTNVLRAKLAKNHALATRYRHPAYAPSRALADVYDAKCAAIIAVLADRKT